MKNKTIVWFALLLVIVLTLSACGKAKRGENESTPIVYEAEAEILVANTLGEPLSRVDATVLFAEPGEDIKQLAKVSSEEGRIFLKGLPNKSTVQIQLKADGYASQVLVLNTGDANNKVIKNEVLIKRQPPTTFDSSKTASVLAIDGAKVNVPAASFVDADGNVVMGDIDVTITPIDVSTPAGLEAFPGSFSGVFEDGEEAPLIVSYGTTEYQFTQDGKELQLKEGALADIEIPIYFDTHVNGDPIVEGDSIPLWYLNEETGIWEQEGFGTVARSAGSPTGFVLQGKVAHFSWWNCDVARRLRQSESVGGGGGGDSDEDIEMINVIFTASIDGDTDQFSQETRDSMLAHITATTRGMLATKLVDFDAPTDLLIPTSVNLCYSAYTNIYSESDPGVSFRFSSQERCQIFSKANDGMHINLRVFVGGEFSIEAQVPQTATVGTAFGACGTSPRIVTHNAAGSVSYKILNVASLPAGLVLSQSSGNIYGVPTEVVPAVNPRSRSLHIEATDELGRKAETIFNIELFDELEISGGAITPILQIDQPFILQDYFRISGGYSPYSYFESNTPAGAQVRIDDIGTRDVISLEGTPPSYTVNGQVPLYSKYPWEIQVEDQNCARSTHGYEFWVIHGPDIDDVKPSPSEVLIGELFSFTPVNNGAVADHWELLEGPEWLSITDGDGRLEGRPELSDLGMHRIRVLATNDVVASFDDGLVQDSIDLGQGRSILEFDLSVMPGEPEFLDFSNHTAVKNTAF
ncbi:MAG: Ig domain-containing protein, partial [Gammaproteobacteria bacterium]|nr:Ig domain-containing protein [Gammaproteobacteria bacterium]